VLGFIGMVLLQEESILAQAADSSSLVYTTVLYSTLILYKRGSSAVHTVQCTMQGWSGALVGGAAEDQGEGVGVVQCVYSTVQYSIVKDAGVVRSPRRRCC